MKKFTVILILIITCAAVLYGCTSGGENKMENSYEQITPAEAKEIMDERDDCVILDVRTQEEYDEAHIDGAILIPDYEIAAKAENILKDKSAKGKYSPCGNALIGKEHSGKADCKNAESPLLRYRR